METQKNDRAAWLSGPSGVCSVPPRVDTLCRLVLLGAPGVGKGTQAQLLSDRLGACHLSTGDVFRAAVIYGLLERWTTEELLRFANNAAALSCTRRGAMAAVPRLAEVRGALV